MAVNLSTTYHDRGLCAAARHGRTGKDALVDTGEVVLAGEGDGEIVETVRALRADGFDGFFSLEPHLQQADQLGGFSGVDHFTEAHAAFTGILQTEGIDFA